MNCYSIAGIYDLFAEGRLSPSRAEEVKAHLAGCAVCAATLLPAVPESAKASSIKAPSSFKDRLKKAAAASDAPSPVAKKKTQFPEAVAVLVSFSIALGLLHAALGGRPESRKDSAPEEFSVRRLP